MGEPALLLADCAIVLNRLPDRFQQFAIIKRLGEKLHGAGLHRAYGRRYVGMASDENDGKLDLAFNEFVWTRHPAERRRLSMAPRREASSSTTYTTVSSCFIRSFLPKPPQHARCRGRSNI
jgi:hypothetical protein